MPELKTPEELVTTLEALVERARKGEYKTEDELNKKLKEKFDLNTEDDLSDDATDKLMAELDALKNSV